MRERENMRALCMCMFIQSPAFVDRCVCTFGIQDCDLCISHYSVGAKHDDKIKVSCVLCKIVNYIWVCACMCVWMWIHVCPLLIVTYATESIEWLWIARLALGVSDILFASLSILHTFKGKKGKQKSLDRNKTLLNSIEGKNSNRFGLKIIISKISFVILWVIHKFMKFNIEHAK